MSWLILAIVVTLTVSFVCSLFEALVLSTTTAEIEALKKSRPRRGQRLEAIKQELDKTISTILTLNTIANGLGSVVIGALGAACSAAVRARRLAVEWQRRRRRFPRPEERRRARELASVGGVIDNIGVT